jgi:glycosyltransferase involved in cell wall biosynthesis
MTAINDLKELSQASDHSGPAPLVSVVIPCFNAAPFIEQAIRSALEQQGVEIEVIVVDDGSQDDSVARATAIGPPIRVVTQANAGPAAARNRGIRESRGRYVAFLDADDVWLPGKLQAQLAAFGAHPDAIVVYGPFLFWREGAGNDSRDMVVHPRATADAIGSGWLYPSILLDSLVCIITAMVRRELFEAIGAFDEGLRTGEDYDFWIRAARLGRCIHLEQPLACYRLHQGGTTLVPRERCNEYDVVINAWRSHGLTGQHGESLSVKQLNARLYKLCFDHAYQHFWHGRAEIAHRQFKCALRHARWHPKAWIYWVLSACKRLLERETRVGGP